LKRIAVVCPGRGSYTERTLRSLPEDNDMVRRAEELRARYELPPLLELDRAARFDPKLHPSPSNAAPLIWLVSMLDAADALARERCVCVSGNSMGWYTALAVAGALDFDDGYRLVQEMALLQEQHPGGGQVIWPVMGEDWKPDAEREAAVRAALEAMPGECFPSIALGGYAVLAGSDAGLSHLLRALPAVQLGANRYPFKLVQHGPYHTPLAEPVSTRAREELRELGWRRPMVTLVDGRGVRWTPWSTDIGALCEYTLGAQVVAPFDFTLAVRVVLREHAPDELVLPGPGNTLGGPCGQVLVREGWRGVRSKAEFEELQGGERAVVRSMRR
jgi:malonyl CoA-acyl carrier protein transacylase